MSFRHIRIEQEGSVATLTLARPPVNALGRELVEDLAAACDTLSAGAPVRALIVAAEGRNFCAGADLKERQGMSGEEVRRWVPFLNGAFQRIATLPFPTIAAIQGVAAGGGFELALACDFRVLEESGRVGLLEVTLGIIPGAGGTQRLPRLIGPARAKRWIFAAGLHSGPEALMDGAIDFLAPEGGAIERARAFASDIVQNAPLAIRQAKKAIDAGFDLPMEAALQGEIRAYEAIIPTEDRLEALVAFREKRPPVWKGR
ncbi:MAG: enoyl-CoA hydratase [Acidobacteria bacterium]|nr:MAG: enoyl-CoA hydratase [Acidobacteriota bacterium]